MYLSANDRKILNCIQEDIPLEPQPFKTLSKRLAIKEDEFLQRIKRLKDKGIIRSFAAGLNHKKLKFKSTLLALKVPLNRVESIAKGLINYPEVTHCYLRKGEYNLWVVFLYRDGKLKRFIKKLDKQIGKDNILNLITKKQFKLKTSLRV